MMGAEGACKTVDGDTQAKKGHTVHGWTRIEVGRGVMGRNTSKGFQHVLHSQCAQHAHILMESMHAVVCKVGDEDSIDAWG
jgi:hypothetical protein